MKPGTFRIDRVDRKTKLVIRMSGELDLAVADEALSTVREAEGTLEGRILELDFSGLEFADSTALRLMLDAQHRSVADARRLQIRVGETSLQELMRVTGVLDQFTLVG